MTDAEIEERISSFPRWHYEFDLNGHKTPIFNTEFINRHTQRKRYFFDPLVQHYQGTLAGKRVLDLGCNAGFWSLCAIDSGCDYVLGIDGRPMHVQQADFVFQVKGVPPDRYRFVQANLFDIDAATLGRFDIVLCLGLMYHISKPMQLLELISAVNTDVLLIDTELSMVPGATVSVRHESLEAPQHGCDYELVMVPSRLAVLDMVRLFGYQPVALRPSFSDWSGATDFKEGRRRAFMCSKTSGLTGLDIEAEPTTPQENFQYLMECPIPTLAGALGAKLLRKVRQQFGR